MVIKKEVKSHFDGLAHIYDEFKEKNQYYYNYIKSLVSELTAKFSYYSVLDIGCGTGEILDSLSPKTGFGVDISPEMVSLAKKKFKKYNFIASDFDNLDFKGKFDLILVIDVIEHLGSINKSLSIMRKFSKESTKIIISSPSYHWRYILLLGERLGMKMPEGSHKWIPPKTLRKTTENNGLKIIDSGYRLVIPKKMPFFSDMFNLIFYRIPFIRNLGLVYYIVCQRN